MHGAHEISAADGFAYAMLGMIVLSFSVIALLVFCMCRNVARRDREVDELLDELADEETRGKPAKKVPPEPAADPWERDGDWWKP